MWHNRYQHIRPLKMCDITAMWHNRQIEAHTALHKVKCDQTDSQVKNIPGASAPSSFEAAQTKTHKPSDITDNYYVTIISIQSPSQGEVWSNEQTNIQHTGRLWKKCVLPKSALYYRVMCPKVILSKKVVKIRQIGNFVWWNICMGGSWAGCGLIFG